MEKVAEALEEKYAEEFTEYKDSIVEKVDAYMNYVVESYMEENKLAIENGLRTEIAEDFMSGLKALFKEHYIEVPEEKYDVIGELQAKVTELEESLNGQVENNVGLNAEVTALQRTLIIKEMSGDLADTEVNKLTKLLEGVDFDNAEIYKEKVSVIKENYFPREDAIKTAKKSSPQALVEDTGTEANFTDNNNVVSAYASALSRTIKRK
jgi:regulator of replication initiation timing